MTTYKMEPEQLCKNWPTCGQRSV